MRNKSHKILVVLMTSLIFATGCATTRARKPEPAAEQNASQATEIQQQLQAKDQQIQDLQYQLSNAQISPSSNYTSASNGSKSVKSSIVRVSGVSVMDIQKALIHAGFDPGKADGQAGKKTKSAIKKFQKKNHLTPDGVIGEKTWNLLK